MNSFLLIAVSALVVAVGVTPLMRRAALRLGVTDKPNARKIHLQPVPLMGGVAIYFGVLLSMTLLRTFGGEAITQHAPDPERLVLALPCPLDDACVPGPCSYGWQGEAELVPRILEVARLDAAAVLVLNDAELAAETALASTTGAAPSRMLVLTIGFGPGGALVTT